MPVWKGEMELLMERCGMEEVGRERCGETCRW